ncbi:MAG: PD-(D/E)XK nuclease family protein [Candidatus Heimdallarchaeota archaeon]
MNDVLQQLDIFFNPPQQFKFNEDKHQYSYDKILYTSVTTFITRFKKNFDSDYWLHYKAKERQIPIQQLAQEWKGKSDLGLKIGSLFHKWVEDFLNNLNPELPKIDYDIDTYKAKEIESLLCIRIQKWLIMYQQKLYKMIPVAQELRVWSKRWRLAGTIDALFWYKNRLIVGDWKSNKAFRTDTDKIYDFLLWPFDLNADNHHNMYSLQVSLYRLLLEEHNIITGPSFICWVPVDEKTNAQFIRSKDYRHILREYLNDNVQLN